VVPDPLGRLAVRVHAQAEHDPGMAVGADQAWHHVTAGKVHDHRIRVRQAHADRLDPAVGNTHVHSLAQRAASDVDDVDTPEKRGPPELHRIGLAEARIGDVDGRRLRRSARRLPLYLCRRRRCARGQRHTEPRARRHRQERPPIDITHGVLLSLVKSPTTPSRAAPSAKPFQTDMLRPGGGATRPTTSTGRSQLIDWLRQHLRPLA
jgi:hypothetical protein